MQTLKSWPQKSSRCYFSWNLRLFLPCHRITLRVWMWSSCSTSHWKCEYKLKINWRSKFRRSRAEKLTFSEIFNFFTFFGSVVPPSSWVSISIKPIDSKILPASIYSRSSSIRKWIQIEIWMSGTSFLFDFKSLASSICCRPPEFKFPRTPYYSPSVDEAILLYESLKIILQTKNA